MDPKRKERIDQSPWFQPESARPSINLYIDSFSHCNLRCPSCAVGNIEGNNTVTKGLLTPELLATILEKALAEMKLTSVGLYNWTEPFLNPHLPDLIRVVKDYDQWCALSTNLNVLRNPDELFEAKPDWLRVSVSGFDQDTYVKAHVGGDIEDVKRNMILLAESRDRCGATTDIEVFFHKYVDNQEDEEMMKRFSESLGFKFVSAWAYMMPVEKVLAYVDPNFTDITLNDADLGIFDRLALETNEAVAVSSSHKLTSCSLQEEMVTMDVEGNVMLCCAASGKESNILCRFLDHSFADIQEMKHNHSLCGPCLKVSLPVLYGHMDSRFEEIGRRVRNAWRTAHNKPVITENVASAPAPQPPISTTEQKTSTLRSWVKKLSFR